MAGSGWSFFPIICHVNYPNYSSKRLSPNEHHCRTRIPWLCTPSVRCLKGKVATVTLEPFPMLTQLWLSSKDENLSVLPGALLGWICPMLARNPCRRHSLSDVINASFICHRPRRSLSSPYTRHWVYFTRSDGRESRHIDQTRRPFH